MNAEAAGAQSIPTTIASAVGIRPREMPIRISRVPGLEDSVTESQMLEALCASLPQWNPPIVALLLHELRLWGPSGSFSDRVLTRPWSGTSALHALLSDKLCRERTAADGGSYLLDSPFGICVVRRGSADATGTRGEEHHGQLLQVLGEVAAPLSTPVETESGRKGTIAEVLRLSAGLSVDDGLKSLFVSSDVR